MKIRLTGRAEELSAAMERLQHDFVINSTTKPCRSHNSGGLYRMYIDADITRVTETGKNTTRNKEEEQCP